MIYNILLLIYFFCGDRIASENRFILATAAPRTFCKECLGKETQMKTIPLTKGKSAIIDDEDYHWICKQKWYEQKVPKTSYARCDKIYMHRAILYKHQMLTVSQFVDHVNKNGLDNRKINLRACSCGENIRNSAKQANTTSRYKGVHCNGRSGKWNVNITVDGNTFFKGSYDDEVYAARVYDYFARIHYKEFAALNFPTLEKIPEPTTKKTSKYKGVSYLSKEGKWKASICFNYNGYYLGLYDTEEEAHQCYISAIKKCDEAIKKVISRA